MRKPGTYGLSAALAAAGAFVEMISLLLLGWDVRQLGLRPAEWAILGSVLFFLGVAGMMRAQRKRIDELEEKLHRALLSTPHLPDPHPYEANMTARRAIEIIWKGAPDTIGDGFTLELCIRQLVGAFRAGSLRAWGLQVSGRYRTLDAVYWENVTLDMDDLAQENGTGGKTVREFYVTGVELLSDIRVNEGEIRKHPWWARP